MVEKKSLQINAAELKWIAICLMALNHACVGLTDIGVKSYFVNDASWYLSRVAFLIFAYQIAEGMHYTRNRKKYIAYIFLFAIISEIPFDLCFSSAAFDVANQNVLWTLGMAAGAIALAEKWTGKPIWFLLTTLGAMILCTWLCTDYSALGVVTVVSFYYFRNNKIKQLRITAILFCVFCVTDYLHSYAILGTTVADTLANDGFWYLVCLELHGLLAWPLLKLYNGQKGKNISKWFFYIFYPGHMLLTYLLCLLLQPIL